MPEQPLADAIRDHKDDYDRYTVYCGYEFTWREGLGLLNSHTHMPQIVAADIPFTDAAHILRTLDEKGEGDMVYGMVPSHLFEILRDQVDANDAFGKHERGLVERLFEHYLTIVLEDLAVDPEWTNEELWDHIRLALATEPTEVLDEHECSRCGKLHTATEIVCEDCRTALR